MSKIDFPISWLNKRVSQMRALIAARREPAEDNNKPPNVLHIF